MIETCYLSVKMHVYEVEETKALWLALRADAHQVLGKVLGVNAQQVSELEKRVYYYSIVPQETCITPYHMVLYKELLSQIRLAHPDLRKGLVDDFKTNMPKLIKSYTSHISVLLHDANEEVKEYETESKRLFYTEVRPKLMALAANTTNDLPSCPTCKTNEFMSTIEIQTRSGDEAATVYAKCMKCQNILTDTPLNN